MELHFFGLIFDQNHINITNSRWRWNVTITWFIFQFWKKCRNQHHSDVRSSRWWWDGTYTCWCKWSLPEAMTLKIRRRYFTFNPWSRLSSSLTSISIINNDMRHEVCHILFCLQGEMCKLATGHSEIISKTVWSYSGACHHSVNFNCDNKLQMMKQAEIPSRIV